MRTVAAQLIASASLMGVAHAQQPFIEPAPSVAVPCDLGGWSIDPDPAGLNVRAAPTANARVVGRLAPPWAGDGSSSEPFRTEFRIIGFQSGWFHIDQAQEPGAPYSEPPPPSHPRSFTGRGWVAARLVGGAYAYGSEDGNRASLRSAPRDDAPEVEGTPEVGDNVAQLVACVGPWGLTVTRDGRRGWWRGICSNQVTNCS